MAANNEPRVILLSTSLTENYNRDLEHWLPKMEGNKDMKGLCTYLLECVLTRNMSGIKKSVLIG